MEIFKEIPNTGGRYSASNYGEILDNYSGVLRKKRLRTDGYLDVNLYVNNKWHSCLCQRLVLMAFKGMPDKEKNLARHLDGVRTNNTPENLKWGTYKENRADRILHGTSGTGNNFGENAGGVILSNKDVFEIKHLTKARAMSQKDIAKLYCVNREAISKISLGKRWKHILI